MKLLIDIGNTRLKWALARDGALHEHGALMHNGAPASAIAQLPLAATGECWIAQVTGSQQEQDLGAAVQQRFGCEAQFARSSPQWRGLRNAYREPQRLGIDRWLAMIAAWHRHPGAACVVDAGTALTVDVIAADGAHQGGLIAAGLQTQQAAVLGATRFAFREQHAGQTARLGQDTESCVRQGALLACLGAIDRAAATAEAGARQLITGGDAERLLPQLGERWQHRPLLVLEGLLALSEHPGS